MSKGLSIAIAHPDRAGLVLGMIDVEPEHVCWQCSSMPAVSLGDVDKYFLSRLADMCWTCSHVAWEMLPLSLHFPTIFFPASDVRMKCNVLAILSRCTRVFIASSSSLENVRCAWWDFE